MVLFKGVSCILCVMYRRGPLGTYFASLEAGMSFVVMSVGGTMQLAFPEGKLAGVTVVGHVRRPPERRYSSIDGVKRVNVFIDLC